jgi:hypothetical protein
MACSGLALFGKTPKLPSVLLQFVIWLFMVTLCFLLRRGFILLAGVAALILCSSWGFFAHKKINQLAVFTLPPDMIGFYKKNIEFITEASCNPDRRRYAVADEAPKHYIDLDDYGDSAVHKLPRFWKDAVLRFGQDTLQAHGTVPWVINSVFQNLRDAMFVRNPEKILRYSAELGHYVADAHVPLHTTSNYDGQKTGQQGIHAFWESRVPELHFNEYHFFVGRAEYIHHVQAKAWQIIATAHAQLDSVLTAERDLSNTMGDLKFSFEQRGRQTVRVHSTLFTKRYHEKLNGMVERQMQRSVKAIGDLWYTAWVDAGQPDLRALIDYTPSPAELLNRNEELKKWKELMFTPRMHEDETSH